jgi:hypothetical protein
MTSDKSARSRYGNLSSRAAIAALRFVILEEWSAACIRRHWVRTAFRAGKERQEAMRLNLNF